MSVAGIHPIVTILILFVLFFSVFFLLIYGGLQSLERRKAPKSKIQNQKGTPVQTKTQMNDDKSKSCPKCGSEMPRFADFCPECGTPQIPAQ